MVRRVSTSPDLGRADETALDRAAGRRRGSRWASASGLGGRGRCASPDDLVERRLGLGRREHHVELHVRVGGERLLEGLLRARLVVAPAAAHDADVHPGLAERAGLHLSAQALMVPSSTPSAFSKSVAT